MTYPVFIFYEMRIFFCFYCLTLKRNFKIDTMKTGLSKKSLAAVLAAVVLSTGAFLGISLSLSQKANAQYMRPNCITLENGVPVRKCKPYNKYECNVSASGTDEKGNPVTIEFLCLGQPISEDIDDENDHLIENPSIRP